MFKEDWKVIVDFKKEETNEINKSEEDMTKSSVTNRELTNKMNQNQEFDILYEVYNSILNETNEIVDQIREQNPEAFDQYCKEIGQEAGEAGNSY